MVIRCRIVLGAFLATSALRVVAGDLAVGGGIGAYYGVPLVRGMHEPWFSCTPPYRCRDPVQLRLELERHHRLQELREQATPPEPRFYGPRDGPWGLQRYVPPPTPEVNIQPEHRGTSRLRPEYDESARPIRERSPE